MWPAAAFRQRAVKVPGANLLRLFSPWPDAASVENREFGSNSAGSESHLTFA